MQQFTQFCNIMYTFLITTKRYGSQNKHTLRKHIIVQAHIPIEVLCNQLLDLQGEKTFHNPCQ